jgi:hypothetical protein
MRALCRAHLIVLILTTLIAFYKKKRCFLTTSLRYFDSTLLLLLTNVLVNTLFPNAEQEEQMLNLYEVLQLIFFCILSHYVYYYMNK